jgi:mannose-6-phosphate isomerase-like protein (cupin superfamily)
MQHHHIDNFDKGWFVGDFKPTLVPNQDMEVAVKYYTKGQVEPWHHHKVAVEYTMIVYGKVQMQDQVFEKGAIIEIAPGESTNFIVLEDTATVVVKFPSVKNDKYLDEQ